MNEDYVVMMKEMDPGQWTVAIIDNRGKVQRPYIKHNLLFEHAEYYTLNWSEQFKLRFSVVRFHKA